MVTLVSDKNTCRSIDSGLTTHSTILGFNFTTFCCCTKFAEQLSLAKTQYTFFSVSSPQRFLFPLNLTRRSASLHFVNTPYSDQKAVNVDVILFFSNGMFDVIT